MIIIYSFRAANIQTFRKLSYLCKRKFKNNEENNNDSGSADDGNLRLCKDKNK